MVATGGVPQMILMAEFAEDTIEQADARRRPPEMRSLISLSRPRLRRMKRRVRSIGIVRRESFRSLRKNLHGLYASPLLTTSSCHPTLSAVLPELNEILAQYKRPLHLHNCRTRW